MAKAHDVVVLPTPPFPPTNIQRSVFWSMRFWRVGSRTSSASKTVEDMIEENDVQQISSLRSACALQVISCEVVVGQFLCATECRLGHQTPEASRWRKLGPKTRLKY